MCDGLSGPMDRVGDIVGGSDRIEDLVCMLAELFRDMTGGSARSGNSNSEYALGAALGDAAWAENDLQPIVGAAVADLLAIALDIFSILFL